MYELVVGLAGFAIIAVLSDLASGAGRRLWDKCFRRESCPSTQERISNGKAQSR